MLHALLQNYGADERTVASLLAETDPQHARIVLADTPLGGPLSVGEAFRAMRLRRGRNQSDLARSVGVSQPTIARWERGDLEPTSENVHAVGYALGATPEELVALAGLSAKVARHDDFETRYKVAFSMPHALGEVLWMGLEADLWRHALQSPVYDEMLQAVLLHRADWYTYAGFPERTLPLAQRAMRLGHGPPRDKPQTGAYGVAWATISTGQDLRHAIDLLQAWEPQARPKGGLPYAQVMRAMLLAEAESEEALPLAERALRTAAMENNSHAFRFVGLQTARIRVRLGREEDALASLTDRHDADAITIRALAAARLGQEPSQTWITQIRKYSPTREIVLYRSRLTTIERTVARLKARRF